MPFTVTMPKLSPTMEEGTIVKWHVKEGEKVEVGSVLMEVATDKATVEHSAIDEGFLRKIIVPAGGSAQVNQPIAIFTETKDESIAGYQPQGVAPMAAPVQEKVVAKEATKAVAPAQPPAPAGAMAQPSFVPEAPLEKIEWQGGTPVPFKGRVLASPLAKKQAEEAGIDISTVKGSGPHGRIVSRDVAGKGEKGLVHFSRGGRPAIPAGTFEEEALTPMRKTIGRRLQESKTFVPHFYVTQEIDAAPMVALREQLKIGKLNVTFNDFILRGCALALRDHPEINSGFNSVNQTLIRFKTIDISVAVTLPAGLITPIIRHTDYKDLGMISTEMRALAEKARSGKLSREEYMGGSFTVSNLGMFGVDNFVGVINPPQGALLAVAGIQDKPVVREGQIVAGKTLSLTLSSDHRVIDGTDAAKFLVSLKKILENPALLLV